MKARQNRAERFEMAMQERGIRKLPMGRATEMYPPISVSLRVALTVAAFGLLVLVCVGLVTIVRVSQ
jgi:hypothetical protein